MPLGTHRICTTWEQNGQMGQKTDRTIQPVPDKGGEPGRGGPGGRRLMLRRFGETSSVKGLGKLLKSSSPFLRALWLLTLLSGGSYATYLTCELVSSYLSYDVTTSTRRMRTAPPFPDVSVCDLNPLKDEISEAFMYERFASMLQGTREKYSASVSDRPALDRMRHVLSSDDRNFSLAAAASTVAHVTGLSGFFRTVPLRREFEEKVKARFTRECKAYSWAHTEMVLDCAQLVGPVFSIQEHEMCVTIRVPEDHLTDISGISLLFYLDNFNDISMPFYHHSLYGSTAVGLRIYMYMHPRNTVPEMEKGVSFPPGHEVTVRMSAHRRKLRKPPYGNCTDEVYIDEGAGDDGEQADLRLRTRYTESGCMGYLAQQKVIEECGCLAGFLVYTRHQKHTGGHEFCANLTDMRVNHEEFGRIRVDFNLTEEKVFAAMGRVYCAYLHSVHEETDEPTPYTYTGRCLRQCDSLDYDVAVSGTPWPHYAYQMAFYKAHIRGQPFEGHFRMYEDILAESRRGEHSGPMERLRQLSVIEDNFSQLKVVFTGPAVDVYEDAVKHDWSGLLGSLGGALNLWIGFSFVTCVELVELLYNMVVGDKRAGTVAAKSPAGKTADGDKVLF